MAHAWWALALETRPSISTLAASRGSKGGSLRGAGLGAFAGAVLSYEGARGTFVWLRGVGFLRVWGATLRSLPRAEAQQVEGAPTRACPAIICLLAPPPTLPTAASSTAHRATAFQLSVRLLRPQQRPRRRRAVMLPSNALHWVEDQEVRVSPLLLRANGEVLSLPSSVGMGRLEWDVERKRGGGKRVRFSISGGASSLAKGRAAARLRQASSRR